MLSGVSSIKYKNKVFSHNLRVTRREYAGKGYLIYIGKAE